MQNIIIETDENGLELAAHGDTFFPLAGYDELFSKFLFQEVPWHWHEEIEIVIVWQGSTLLEYVDGSFELKTGEGVFINSNILHRFTQTSEIDCRIINFVFKAELISGKMDSLIYTHYVKPLLQKQDASAIHLSPEVEWQKAYIHAVEEAFYHHEQAGFGFELAVKANLSLAWFLLVKNLLSDTSLPDVQTVYKTRIDTMIKYIHQHVDEKIAIGDLAKHADISESECYRIFQKFMHVTPNHYIISHKLQRAALLLIESDRQMIDISNELGFSNPSYFAKKFKEKYAMSPLQFRKDYLKS